MPHSFYVFETRSTLALWNRALSGLYGSGRLLAAIAAVNIVLPLPSLFLYLFVTDMESEIYHCEINTWSWRWKCLRHRYPTQKSTRNCTRNHNHN